MPRDPARVVTCARRHPLAGNSKAGVDQHVLVPAEDTPRPTAATRVTGPPTKRARSRSRSRRDHQIENGPDVDGAPGERPVPFGLHEFRANRPPDQFLKRRIEPFDVPDLQRRPVFSAKCDEVVGFRERGEQSWASPPAGYRDASLQERRGDRVARWWTVGVTTLTASRQQVDEAARSDRRRRCRVSRQ